VVVALAAVAVLYTQGSFGRPADTGISQALSDATVQSRLALAGQPGREELPCRCRLRGGSPRRRHGQRGAAVRQRRRAQALRRRNLGCASEARGRRSTGRGALPQSARVLDPTSPSIVELAAKWRTARQRDADDQDRRKSCRPRSATAGARKRPAPPSRPAARQPLPRPHQRRLRRAVTRARAAGTAAAAARARTVSTPPEVRPPTRDPSGSHA
jgi:hypothetical protein